MCSGSHKETNCRIQDIAPKHGQSSWRRSNFQQLRHLVIGSGYTFRYLDIGSVCFLRWRCAVGHVTAFRAGRRGPDCWRPGDPGRARRGCAGPGPHRHGRTRPGIIMGSADVAAPGGVPARGSGLERSGITRRGVEPAGAPDSGAGLSLADIYRTHYLQLVRLAGLLGGDAGAAEEIVQESFVALHQDWRRFRANQQAVSYLQRRVVLRCRAAQRHRPARARGTAVPAPRASADAPAVPPPRPSVVRALAELPPREREVVALTYYLGLSDAQTAAVTGQTRPAVRRLASRATAALRILLGQGG
jgi:DNA-directed RNA polymerase specialized sigma24 family protein